MRDNPAHVRLLTLLNVGAAIPRDNDVAANDNLKGKRGRGSTAAPAKRARKEESSAEPIVTTDDVDDAPAQGTAADAFITHFGAESADLEAAGPTPKWSSPKSVAAFGGSQTTEPEGKGPGGSARPHTRTWSAYKSVLRGSEPPQLERELIECLGVYKDFWHSRVKLQEQTSLRRAIAVHVMSHISKTRQRILKDNERLAHAAASDAEELPELRDQGFTRPKALILAPLRNSAKNWVDLLVSLSGAQQIEQKSRFAREYSLPAGTVDKLADPAFANKYPEDHRATFSGNIDDNFRIGIKATRKTLKLYSPFFESDIIVASPLGLRLLIEKEKDADYLSSIEVLVADQLDVMLMQNWEHVKFFFEHVSQIPRQARDTDFSRVKPWYLDGQAALLRQTVLLSSYDAPEFRHLYGNLKNVAGRLRTVATDEEPSMSLVTPGIRQTFHRFDVGNVQAEADVRLHTFTEKTLPGILKSAVSATHTMIVVPSYFDFVRFEYYLRKNATFSYSTLTEYTSNRDISRAREAFFSGKSNFLIVTERFHFYRRYLVRGAKTVVFYAPPEHAIYYPELVNAPLLQRDGQEADIDASDISVVVLYSKYDLLRLERIVGIAQGRRMVTESKAVWRFA
ncbi:rRNA-binding ribosome biosynthesis protein utp25 [Malassezia cuniculi]|uniref:U3 small nucleolar RNA-associated protein 25 n=1 Tax=Malassezia cuniculi TaxID=948313 RepID=A0AAF0ESZ8_9BASI|nr:rRNA-binding ribosome biosynthesis protein utp25 [Malassezia cuniculi]